MYHFTLLFCQLGVSSSMWNDITTCTPNAYLTRTIAHRIPWKPLIDELRLPTGIHLAPKIIFNALNTIVNTFSLGNAKHQLCLILKTIYL
jgi:hypothetical protein